MTPWFPGDAQGGVYDSIENLTRLSNNDTLAGDDDHNILSGWCGNDVLAGYDGEDILHGGAGADQFFGGGGRDTVSYRNADYFSDLTLRTLDARMDSGLDAPTGDGAAMGDQNYIDSTGINDIENLEGSYGSDQLVGDHGDNYLCGLSGHDTIYGGIGSDLFYGGDDNNDLYGGDGNDYIRGDAGNAALVGGAGNDSLVVGDGNDTLYSDAGADVMDGRADIDTVTYIWSIGAVYVDNTANYAWGGGGDADGDTFTDIENRVGTKYNDTLIGSAADNRIEGGYGDDELSGLGRSGTIRGGDGTDWVNYFDSGAGVNINMELGFGIGADAHYDVYSSIENVIESQFSDMLQGNAGNNVLNGHSGDDLLIGNGGADFLNGNFGIDTVDWFLGRPCGREPAGKDRQRR